MKIKKEISTLTSEDVEAISGGVAPVLGALMWGFGYIGALQTAADFGAGLGRGLYDSIHRRQ